MKNTLYTDNGVKELDEDVANYIKAILKDNDRLRKERKDLKIKVFKLEARLSRGWRRIFH